jgi:condensin complex subunit 1
MIKAAPASSFPIPSSLQDLERAPYNLLPYPHDFEDDDEAARADSFDALVQLVEEGNRTLVSGSLTLFEDDADDEPWMGEDRIQALYTLVRLVARPIPSRCCLLS